MTVTETIDRLRAIHDSGVSYQFRTLSQRDVQALQIALEILKRMEDSMPGHKTKPPEPKPPTERSVILPEQTG